jgi:U3 small nucleolar RNA-associated protein MPP10
MSLTLDLFAGDSTDAITYLKEKITELVELSGKEIYTDNFDEEQIWSQIQSRRFKIPKFKTEFDLIQQEEEQEEEDPQEDTLYQEEEEQEQDPMEQEVMDPTFERTSGTNDIDKFIENMESILDTEEQEEIQDEENMELYAEDHENEEEMVDSEDNLENYMNKVREHYKEDLENESEDEDEGFFDASGKPNHKTKELSKKEEKEFLNEVDKQEKKILEQMETLEEDTLKEKEWKYTGEVTSVKRPKGSLLEQDVDFNHTGKAKPVITEQVTQNLEEMILHRIISGIFDDPQRIKEDQIAKKTKELNHEKSKESLAELYQKEYEKRVTGTIVTPVEEQHVLEAKTKVLFEVKQLMSTLNQLSNLHFIPEPSMNEAVVNKVEDAMITLQKETPQEIMKPISNIKEEIKFVAKTKSALTQDKEKRVKYTSSKEFFGKLQEQSQ